MLEPVFEQAPGYRRVYVDLPGFGASPATGSDSTAGVVMAVDELISEEVGEERFLIVGESYGGYLSREIVRRRRTQVAGMALVCPVGEPLGLPGGATSTRLWIRPVCGSSAEEGRFRTVRSCRCADVCPSQSLGYPPCA